TIGNLVLLNPQAGGGSIVSNFTDDDISWSADRSRFQKTSYTNDDVYPPPNWDKRYPRGYTKENPIPDLSQDQHLQVWMRTAPLATFRKLFAINKKEGLSSGQYQVNITMNYNTLSFAGTKSFVLATTNSIGGKNPVLGIVYMAVGSLFVLLGCVFTVIHLYRPRRLGDHTYLSWNQQIQSGLNHN
ncbi:hypothetical protein BB560_004105, partial [Smittium megazygosporum]